MPWFEKESIMELQNKILFMNNLDCNLQRYTSGYKNRSIEKFGSREVLGIFRGVVISILMITILLFDA